MGCELHSYHFMTFNDKLFDYLAGYNLQRLHYALRLLFPMQVIANYL